MLSELSVLRRNLWGWNQGWARRLGPNQQPQKKTLPLAQLGQTIPSATVNIYHSQKADKATNQAALQQPSDTYTIEELDLTILKDMLQYWAMVKTCLNKWG